MIYIDQKQWIHIKNQGKGKYLLIHWVLLAAIPAAIILSIIRGFVSGFVLSYFSSAEFLKDLALLLFLCIIISLIAGNRRWKKNEKFYGVQ